MSMSFLSAVFEQLEGYVAVIDQFIPVHADRLRWYFAAEYALKGRTEKPAAVCKSEYPSCNITDLEKNVQRVDKRDQLRQTTYGDVVAKAGGVRNHALMWPVDAR